MYKLTVIAGPNRGSSFAVQEGETSIGRQGGNEIVLQSSRVSKRHCVLVCSNGELVIRDNHSANGTFVNGVLSNEKKVGPGDRISVGEFVLEVGIPPRRGMQHAPAVAGMGEVLQFPGAVAAGGNAMVAQHAGAAAAHGAVPGGDPMAAIGGVPGVAGGQAGGMPSDLRGRLIWRFEHKLMPFFYNLNMKHEWRVVGIGLAAFFVLANLVISVEPILNSSTKAIIQETKRRAGTMARVLVTQNTPAIAQGAETKTTIESVERERGVRVAVITDLESRIIAPASRMNQYFTVGTEAKIAIAARDSYRRGSLTKGISADVDGDTVMAIEPIKVFNPRNGQNEIVAMAIVSLDSSLATLQMGEMGMIYAEALITTGLLAALVLAILYRLTLKPFQVLNDDIDRVLKGDMPEVTHEFKMEELNSLWDIINSTLQRVPRGESADPMGMGMGAAGPNIDDYLGPMRMFGGIGKFGIVVCDDEKKILYVNELFEEITGIRGDSSIGQELSSVGRDQAFNSMVTDLFERVPTGGDGLTDEFEFSGISYKMSANALGSPGASAKGYVLIATRAEG